MDAPGVQLGCPSVHLPGLHVHAHVGQNSMTAKQAGAVGHELEHVLALWVVIRAYLYIWATKTERLVHCCTNLLNANFASNMHCKVCM